MAFPEFDRPFVVLSDASDTQVSSVLAQVDKHGIERPIAYATRALTPAEQRYGITDKECAALVWSVTKLWRHYLDGCCGVIAIADHASLTTLMSKENLQSKRQQRYALDLSAFPLTIMHRPGVDLLLPDLLSRCGLHADAAKAAEELKALVAAHGARVCERRAPAGTTLH